MLATEDRIGKQITYLDLFLTRGEAAELMRSLADLLEYGDQRQHSGHFHVFDTDSACVRKIQASLYDPAKTDDYGPELDALFRDGAGAIATFDWSFQNPDSPST
jgi:hypothetical protein